MIIEMMTDQSLPDYTPKCHQFTEVRQEGGSREKGNKMKFCKIRRDWRVWRVGSMSWRKL